MPLTKTQKADKDYKRTRTEYLQDRVRQTNDQLRSSGISKKKRNALNDQLKSQKDNLSKIKSKSNSEETTMSKLSDKYRASVVKTTAASKDLTPQEMHDKLVARLKVLGERLKNAKTRKDKAVIPHIEKMIAQVEEAKKESEDKIAASKRKKSSPANPSAKKDVPTKKPADKPEGKGFQETILDAWGGDENAMRALHNNGIDIKDVTTDIFSGANQWTAMRQIKKSMGDREFDYNAKDAPGLEKAITKYKRTVETKNNTRGQGRAGGRGDETHKPTSRPVSGTKKPAAKPAKIAKESFTSDEMISKTRTKIKQLKDRLVRAEKNGSSNVSDIKKEIEKTTEFQQELMGKKKARNSKSAPATKTAPTSTRKPIDKVKALKRQAQTLTGSGINAVDRSAILDKMAKAYDSMTPAERNASELTTFMTGQNLKLLAKKSENVGKMLAKNKSELLSAGDVRNNFAKDAKVAKLRKAAPAKKPAAKPEGKDTTRYTKRGVTQMLKQLRESQEKGRKDSAAYKQRDADIKRLTKVLKTLSSMDDNSEVSSVSDNYRISVIAAYMEEGYKLVATAATENEIVNEIARSTKSQIRKGRRPKLITKSPITEESLTNIGNQLIRKGPFKLQLDELLMKDSDDEFSIYLTWVPDDQDEDENEVLVSIDQDGEIHINYG